MTPFVVGMRARPREFRRARSAGLVTLGVVLAVLGTAWLVSAATWSVAFFEGYKMADTPGDATAAGHVFLRLIDRGFQSVAAAAAGTPYVEAG